MDAVATDTAKTAKTFARGGVAAMFFLGLLMLALGLGKRGTLVDPIPLPITLASGAAFFAAGVWLSFQLMTPSYFGTVQRLMAHIAMPIFALIIGTFLARTAVEAAAFVGVRPMSTTSIATVVGKTSQKWGEHGVVVSFGPETRRVIVEVAPALWGRLDPYRALGRDCLSLSTQTGRWGIRRAVLPRRFFDDPITADHYLRCAQQ